MKQFVGTCVDNPFDSLEDLEDVTNNAEEITIKEFFSEIDAERINAM